MDAAAKTVKELTQRILPEKPHYLSYSLDWRYHIPANESRQEQTEKLETTRLEYSTFISDADRGVLFTRSYYDMRVEPQQPPLRDVGSLKEGDEKNERSLSDYDLQASLLPTGLSNGNDWKISSPSSDSTSELPSDQKRNIDHAGEKPGSWPNTLGESDGERPGGSHTLHEVVPAVPPTDSGYASAPAMGSEFGRLSKGSDQVATQSTQNPVEQDISDTATEYSEVSTTANSRKQTYVQVIVGDLSKKINWLNVDDYTQTRISEILPELLKDFALKVGYDGPTQMHRDVMAFVHRHRCDIATALEDIGFKQHQESPKISTAQSDGMDYEERIRRWFVDDSFESGRMSPWWGKQSAELDRIHEESQGLDTNDIGFREHENGLRGPYTGDGDDHITSVKGVAEANNEEVPESWLQAYRDFIPGTEAYQWLVTRLQREFRLVPTEPNTIGSIGGAIMSSLPSAHKISRRISTQRCSARFELQWDIFHFFQTQEYPGPPDEVLEGIITLTGSSLDAQAATCAQYIHQTWPSTGETTLQLIKEVLKDGDGYLSSCKLSDGTTLSAWVDGSKFIAEASGVAVSVMEIGEQLAWLGAALRTSTRQSGLIYCTPNISILHNNASSTLLRLQLSSADITCEIGFTMEEAPQTPDNANGQCWHDIFRNPVVVRGYPILRRVECSTGLEVPLNIMAGLARTQSVDRFNDKIYIKGFSTMLVPTRRKEDILCWHLIYNKDGNRISYLDSDVAQEQDVARLNLESLRHVLGWCSKAQVLAGSAEAHYPVACSGLPNPDEECALAKTWVSAGRMIIGGPKFNLGIKDTPIQISRHGYVPRLQWLATKLVLLWDERDKRGWLINGTSALLHVLRASLKHDNEGALGDLFLCSPEDLQEPNNRFTADSAIEVLVKSKNRSLRLYGEKDGDILLENRIDHLYNILEKLIDHQADIAGYCGEKLEGKPRKYLEGWDFEDLMLSTTSDLHARVATLDASGKSWVDLTRAVHAVTLVGCGFGNIIRPANASICDHWTELPKQKYYITSCFSDLNRVVKQHGSLSNPFVRLSHNLIWHTPTTMFEACRCRGSSEKDQCEPVQTLFPLALSERLPPRTEAVSEEKHGALIFGTTSHFPWVWGDTGFPREGEDGKASDSGIGSSQAISASESESNPRFMGSPSDFHASSGVQNSAASTSCKGYPRRVYEVGIICALWKELKAVRALFDSEHDNFNRDEGDDNQYVLGTMANHMVVAACLPAGEYGTNSAASVASNMVRSFPALKFCLLVGIAGGAPSEQNDIRLGDVVVGIPKGRSSGVVQYDLGKDKESNIFQTAGSLRGPPRSLTSAINKLHSDPDPPSELLKQHLDKITKLMSEYRRPAQEAMPCTQCRSSEKVCSGYYGPPHASRPTIIHYGPIGSGNSVIKNATRRDQLAREHGVLCFEMEAAGVVNAVSCLVIRGICDYCDVHKNDDWQNYAAATAAAYSKLLLGVVAGKQGAGVKRPWGEFKEGQEE